MKAMLAGFAGVVVMAGIGWFLLTGPLDYTETQRTTGSSVRLD